ncbi:MAG: TlpA disulfide reductase family protein [Firmicutes bacterium]|nr:TlpA family protein disulfide reductase [Bacillota bacterium]MDD7602604.1 TlpA disulfide reductase family protein [Bacillota bacterium]MDY5855710.1 TlpA disulfide reductase family protein [Anaerovoracaceae bacterium]
MRKLGKTAGIILGMILFIAVLQWVNQVARSAQDTAAESLTDEIVNAAPEFTVYDEENHLVRLGQFQGSPVVIYFWASWSRQSTKNLDAFETAYQEHGGQVQFMMINLTDGARETVERAQTFLRKRGYTVPVYYDRDGSASGAFALRSIPATYFVDENLQLIARANGGKRTAERLEEGLAILLDGDA